MSESSYNVGRSGRVFARGESAGGSGSGEGSASGRRPYQPGVSDHDHMSQDERENALRDIVRSSIDAAGGGANEVEDDFIRRVTDQQMARMEAIRWMTPSRFANNGQGEERKEGGVESVARAAAVSPQQHGHQQARDGSVDGRGAHSGAASPRNAPSRNDGGSGQWFGAKGIPHVGTAYARDGNGVEGRREMVPQRAGAAEDGKAHGYHPTHSQTVRMGPAVHAPNGGHGYRQE